MADIAASVLAQLKNKAKASGISYHQCLQLFFQEEFLRRLAGSKYADNFVLKGGLFIYTLTNFESRATVDVDFLMRGLNNDLARMDEIIAEILAVDTGNDFVTFKATKTEPIAVQRKYHGVSAQITGYIKNVRVPFNVDIGVGDVIVPRAERRNIQTQLEGYPNTNLFPLWGYIASEKRALMTESRSMEKHRKNSTKNWNTCEKRLRQESIPATTPLSRNMLKNGCSFTVNTSAPRPPTTTSTSSAALSSLPSVS